MSWAQELLWSLWVVEKPVTDGVLLEPTITGDLILQVVFVPTIVQVLVTSLATAVPLSSVNVPAPFSIKLQVTCWIQTP